MFIKSQKLFVFILAFLIVGIVPVSSATNSSITSKSLIPMKNMGLGTYYVKVNLANVTESQFMVDTGSGYTTINEESLSKLKETNNATYVKDIKGILANGSTYIVPIWVVSSITLNDQCTLNNVQVAIFPGKTRQILGLSALKKAAPLELSFDPPSLSLGHCDSVG